MATITSIGNPNAATHIKVDSHQKNKISTLNNKNSFAKAVNKNNKLTDINKTQQSKVNVNNISKDGTNIASTKEKETAEEFSKMFFSHLWNQSSQGVFSDNKSEGGIAEEIWQGELNYERAKNLNIGSDLTESIIDQVNLLKDKN